MKLPLIGKFLEKRSTLNEFDKWLERLIAGKASSAGVNVDADTAIQIVAVFACIRLLSETISSLPFPVYKKLEKGREK